MNQIPFLTSSRKFDVATTSNLWTDQKPVDVTDGKWHKHDGKGNPFPKHLQGSLRVEVCVNDRDEPQTDTRVDTHWYWKNDELRVGSSIITRFRVVK